MNVSAPDVTKPPKEPFSWRREIQQWAVLILIVLGIHSFVAKPFFIPSESMMANLLVGDRLIVSKFPYGFSYLSPSVPILPHIPGRLFGSLHSRRCQQRAASEQDCVHDAHRQRLVFPMLHSLFPLP